MSAPSRRGTTGDHSLLRTAAIAVGATFVPVGLLGFIPGITTEYSDLGFAGHESTAMLLGLFQDSADNWLHLALGAGMIVLGVLLGKQTAHR